MKTEDTVTIELTKQELLLIQGCLVMAGTMCTMGQTKTSDGLEQYRKTFNLRDKLEDQASQ